MGPPARPDEKVLVFFHEIKKKEILFIVNNKKRQKFTIVSCDLQILFVAGVLFTEMWRRELTINVKWDCLRPHPTIDDNRCSHVLVCLLENLEKC